MPSIGGVALAGKGRVVEQKSVPWILAKKIPQPDVLGRDGSGDKRVLELLVARFVRFFLAAVLSVAMFFMMLAEGWLGASFVGSFSFLFAEFAITIGVVLSAKCVHGSFSLLFAEFTIAIGVVFGDAFSFFLFAFFLERRAFSFVEFSVAIGVEFFQDSFTAFFATRLMACIFLIGMITFSEGECRGDSDECCNDPFA